MSERFLVMVVEDEPMLRLDAIDMIEGAGFDVVAASNSAEAIKVLEHNDAVRIIVSDIQMPPGMNGMQLVAYARKHWPHVEVVLISGNLNRADVKLPERGLFFSKPYRPAEVVAALNKLVA